MAIKSNTDNLKLPLPLYGHVQAMEATRESFEIIDTEIQQLKENGGGELFNPRPVAILCAGSSNAFTNTPVPTGTYPANIMVWDWDGTPSTAGTQYVPASTLNYRRIDLEFALEFARNNPLQTIYLVNVSFPSSIMASWSRNSPAAYGLTLSTNAAAAIAAIPADQNVTFFDFFLWWSGEADAATDVFRAIYREEFNRFYASLGEQPWFDNSRCKTIICGIVDAPRAPWRIHSQLNYESKKITASSGGTITYLQSGALNNAAYWQPDVEGAVSPFLNSAGIIAVGRRAYNVITHGNSTFVANSHGDNGVAGVLEVFNGIMLPPREFAAQVPGIEHDFDSTLKRYQTRYRGDFATTLSADATISARFAREQMIGDLYAATVSIAWTGNTNTGTLAFPDFMPYENNVGSDLIFMACLSSGDGSEAPQQRVVYARWVLWTQSFEFVDAQMQPIEMTPVGSLSMEISNYRP